MDIIARAPDDQQWLVKQVRVMLDAMEPEVRSHLLACLHAGRVPPQGEGE
jgi:hypothetical protein